MINECDFGINYKEYQWINDSELNNKKDKTKKYEISNPFYISINCNIDFNKYNRVYTLHIKDKNIGKINKIYEKSISASELAKLLAMFYLKKNSIDLLKNNYFKSRACVVDKVYLNMIENNNYNNTELIVPLFEFDEKYSLLNSSIINGEMIDISDLDKVIGLLKIYSNSNLSFERESDNLYENITKCIRSINEFKYWSNDENCKINRMKHFLSRRFNENVNTTSKQKIWCDNEL